MTPESHLDCISTLRDDYYIGYILVPVQQWNNTTATYGDTILRPVAAPSTMTSVTKSFTHDISVHNDNVRGSKPARGSGRRLVPQWFRHCHRHIPDILISTDALVLFPSDFDTTGSATVAGEKIWRSWYFPLGSNVPVGLTWNMEHGNLKVSHYY